MNKSLLTTLTVALFSTSAFAGILKTTPGDKSIEGVQIAKQGAVSLDGRELPVSIVGSGLRKKKVAIVQVKVYVAELLATYPDKFKRTDAEALASLDASDTVALRMNFIRTVDAATVQASFKAGLEGNGLSVQDAPIAQFLTAVSSGGDAISGKSLTVVGQKNADKSETIYYEDANEKLTAIKGPEGLTKKIMSLWLGKSEDAGVEAMKQDIIKGN